MRLNGPAPESKAGASSNMLARGASGGRVRPDPIHDLSDRGLDLLDASSEQHLLGEPDCKPRFTAVDRELVHFHAALIVDPCIRQVIGEAFQDGARLRLGARSLRFQIVNSLE